MGPAGFLEMRAGGLFERQRTRLSVSYCEKRWFVLLVAIFVFPLRIVVMLINRLEMIMLLGCLSSKERNCAGKLLGCFLGKGAGSIRSMARHPELPVLASCGERMAKIMENKLINQPTTVFLKFDGCMTLSFEQ